MTISSTARWILAGTLLTLGPAVARAQSADSARAAYRADHLAMYERYRSLPAPLGRIAMEQEGGSFVDPHWLADGSRFWYEDTRVGADRRPVHTTIYLVDPAANTVTELFDAARLRQALRDAGIADIGVGGIPFRDFEFAGPEETAARFEVEGRTFELDLRSYDLVAAAAETTAREPAPGRCGDEGASGIVSSPDGRWVVCVVDYDVWLVSSSSGDGAPITEGGSEDRGWRVGADPDPASAAWSPDGAHLLLQREDRRHVPRVPRVRWLADPIEVEWIPDESLERPIVELYVFDVTSRELRPVALEGPPPWWIGVIGWRPDGSELIYESATRSGLQEDLRALDPITGGSRLIHSEASDAPVLVDLMWYGQVAGRLLSDGRRLLYVSEDSGSLQLYLKDLDGGPALQLTSGPFPVIRIVDVDEDRGWVYYTAYGDPDRPYDAHLYRVRLDGAEPTLLTSLGANHEATGMVYFFMRRRLAVRLSPSREYFIARRSTPESRPVVELRQADGTLLRVLSRARMGSLAEALQSTPPEEFSVKASDGTTDLRGVLWKPYDFDPGRRYPVIEVFYDEMVPRTFDPTPHSAYAEQLAQLGFVTVMLEGRGANGRGRAFRDAFSDRPGGYIDDHVAALRNLAAGRRYMDLSRVGAFGYSGGGGDVLWALTNASHGYHAGVSVAPYAPTGGPVADALLAGVPDMEGHLLLIHGTADGAALLAATMRFIDACIEAGKPVDLLLVPDGRHGLGRAWDYSMDRARDYFLEHLDP